MKTKTSAVILLVIGIALIIGGSAIEFTPTQSRIGYVLACIGIPYIGFAALLAFPHFFEEGKRYGC